MGAMTTQAAPRTRRRSVALSVEDVQALARLAEENERSIAAEVRFAIKWYLRQRIRERT